jgi:hypothetical protein
MKVGDIFVFEGFNNDPIYGFEIDIGREQQVIEINGDRCYSVFLDTGDENDFGTRSLYISHCVFADGNGLNGFEYENGVPMVWEDVI